MEDNDSKEFEDREVRLNNAEQEIKLSKDFVDAMLDDEKWYKEENMVFQMTARGRPSEVFKKQGRWKKIDYGAETRTDDKSWHCTEEIKENRNQFYSACGTYRYHIAIIDYLQDYNFDK